LAQAILRGLLFGLIKLFVGLVAWQTTATDWGLLFTRFTLQTTGAQAQRWTNRRRWPWQGQGPQGHHYLADAAILEWN